MTEDEPLWSKVNWETECSNSEDRQHCLCWYDGKPCCRCGDAMDYGDVLQALQDSDDVKVARAGWNGKGQWVGMQKPDANSKMTVPYTYLRTVNGDLVPWVPSQTDQLATDWQIVD